METGVLDGSGVFVQGTLVFVGIDVFLGVGVFIGGEYTGVIVELFISSSMINGNFDFSEFDIST